MPPPRAKKQQQLDDSSDEEIAGEAAATSEAELDSEDFFKELEDVEDIVIPPKPELLSNGACLLITHIDIVDFKSYSGKQTIGPFHHALTCIVGPNGSGKSNVIDSLLFVFGFRSSKIRATKLSSFIHHSSTRTANSCSVVVNFKIFSKECDESGHKKVLDSFAIGRVVDKNNKSKYSLNGRTAQFKEIQTILKKSGVDLDHNRFLILQGEVEQISLMKPKAEKEGEIGMLEYLDDIIGTSRFREKVAHLDLKVNRFDSERQRQVMKVQEYEKLKDKLVAPVREMVKILMIENKISHCKHKILSVQIHKKEQSVIESRNRYQELEGEVKEKTDRLKLIVHENSEAKTIVTEKTKQLDEVQKILRKQKEKLDHEQMQLKRNELNLQKSDKLLEDKIKEKAKTEKNIKKLETTIEKNNEETEELKVELETVKETIEEKLPALQESLAKCQQKTDELNTDRNKIGEKLATARNKEDEANAELSLMQSRQLSMTEEVRRYESRLKSAKDMSEYSKEKIQAKEREKETLERKVPDLEKEITDAQSKLKTLKPKELKLSDDYSRLKDQYNSANADCSSDQRTKHVVQMLMREKSNGNIPGVYGRLGNLGAIDAKYDRAISTTCSGLDLIVCDTYDTVKKCLKFLDENKLGRTTFVACDKIGHLKDKMKKIKTPENQPRLFDLVQCNREEIRLAFYFCLRDCLVVDDIVTARRVSNLWGAQNRFRVVTLEGGVVDISGTLTGGGNSIKRGRIGTNVQAMASAESPEDLLPKVNEAKALLDEVRAEISSCQNSLEAKTRAFEQGKGDLRRCREALEMAKSEFSTAENTVKTLSQKLAETNVNEEELQKLADDVKTTMKKRDRFTEAAEQIKQEYDEISKKIDAVYEKFSGNLKKEMDEMKERQTEMEKKIKSLRTAASKAEIDRKKALDNIETIQQKIKDVEVDIQKHNEYIEESQKKVEDLENSFTEKEDAVKSLEIEIKEESEKAEQNNEEEVMLKRIVKESKAEYDLMKEKMEKLTGKVEDLVVQRSRLKLHDIRDLLEDTSVEKKSRKKAEQISSDDDDEESVPDLDSSMEVDQDKTDDSVPMELDEEEDDDAASSCTEDVPVDESRLVDFVVYSTEDIENFDVDVLTQEHEGFQADRKGIKTNLNLSILEEYRKKLADFKKEEAHLNKLSKAVTAVQTVFDRVINKRLDEFNDALAQINEYLRNQYYALSLGGEAYLQAVSPMDSYSEGIKFIVRPKSKGWREIAMTSGGEKTISSLSLVFALHQFVPTPFYVMDEIDAALDFRNVAMISKFVKEKAKNSQFIIISLRDNMYQLANVLIGVYKVQDKAQTCLLKRDAKQPTKKSRKSRDAIMPA